MKKDLLVKNTESLNDFKIIYKRVIRLLLNRVLAERNNDKIFTLLGYCYKKLGQIEKAVSYFEKAVLINPNSYSAFFEMGLCGLKLKKTCVAVNSFIKAIQANPHKPFAVLYLGISHELCEEPDMAFMIYQRLIETTPKFTQAYSRKANLLMQMDLYKEAIPLLNKIISINPENSNAYQRLGKCYQKLGQPTSAYRCYRKILTKNFNTDICASAISEIRKISNQTNRKPQNLKLCKAY